MKRSKPSTEVGGEQMNRDTSTGVSRANSETASDGRSSRSVTRFPVSTGSARCQSVLMVGAGVDVTMAVSALVDRPLSPSLNSSRASPHDALAKHRPDERVAPDDVIAPYQ